jgi:SAM-dependent methyltransferase
VRFGSRRVPAARWCQGDAGGLPYASGAFDAVLFHFTLLWLARPREALLESRRVTRAGGWILALAEPDHAARIDHPEPLVNLGELQTASLQAQGADITMGRQLASLFSGAGLRQVTTGLIGGEWSPSRGEGPSALEWDILRRDLRGRLPKTALDDLEKVDREAHRRGERVLFIPTFYASGQVP